MTNTINTLQKIRRHLKSTLISFFTTKISKKKFDVNYQESLTIYKEKKDTYVYDKYVIKNWKEYTKEIDNFFVNNFSFNFLRHPLLKSTMFAHLPKKSTDIQKRLIKEIFGTNKAKEVLKENNLGNPILNDFEFISSGNNIHHLYHLAKLEKETGRDIKNMKSIVELGGGYGNFVKIVKNLNPEITCTIIDIPVFSYIQLVYLRTIYGRDEVILFDEKQGIIDNKINIVPFHEPTLVNLNNYFKNNPDLFISTWALSESNQETQKLFYKLNFFNSKSILLAYQKANDSFSFSENITKLPSIYDVKYNDVTEYLPDNYYLFAELKNK